MRIASTLAILILASTLAGCGGVHRSTSDDLIAAPATTARTETALGLDEAYRKTLNQMKACYEAGGAFMVHMSVYGDKSASDAQISFGISGITGHRVIATLKLTPGNPGTIIDIYSAGNNPPVGLTRQLDFWLNKGRTGCNAEPTEN